jgi:hypothetical protein
MVASNSVADYFSKDYIDARGKFLDACRSAGLTVDSYHNAAVSGPNAEPLYADVVRAGAADASKMLLTCSATHGVEGFYGSGCQIGWLRERHDRSLPADVAVLHIHAINPYGFAWLRRVNEDNVDVNRNFVDHAAPPGHSDYAELHSRLVPRTWDDHTAAAIQADIDAYCLQHGRQRFRNAVVSGQYSHADGLFYGGTRPVWSNRTITAISERYLQNVESLAVIDFHTGLGPYGYAELICRHPPASAALARARSWYGEAVTAAQAGESESPPIDGNLRMVFTDICPQAALTSIAIEVGTLPMEQVFMAICADNWLHLRGDPDSARGRQIKQAIRRAFFPDEPAWTGPVYQRSLEIMQNAIAGLSA